MDLPYSLDLEAGILGCIILDNNWLNHIAFLEPKHFYSTPHANIYQRMRDLHGDGEPVTPFNLALDSETLVTVKEAGGLPTYIKGAIASANLIRQPVEEARILVSMAQKRDFIAACKQSIEQAASESDAQSAGEHAAHLGAKLESILRGGLTDVQDDYQVSEEILKDMLDDRQPFSTGFFKLDNAMGGGLFPGRAYGFAARKKVGKTILASTISCNLAQDGVKHLFICGEMGPKEIHQRNLARLTQTFPSEFRRPAKETVEFREKIVESVRASKRCILYHNAPGLTFDELKRVASSTVFRHGIKGMILDYWQLVGGKGKGHSTSEHLDEVAQWIADFGRKYAIWTITMAQINQEGNTRGGEGIRLAFDQVYNIKGMGDDEDISYPQRWLEMMDTRYTKWQSIGDKGKPGFVINEFGPYFEPAPY